MTRLTKILVIIIGVLAALFAVAAIAFLLFFDPNDFREDVERAVKESTGRDLAIEGDVSLQLFPWLAVEIGDASLGNAPGFGDGPFAEIESARLSVRLWPLLVRQDVSIGTANLAGLRLALVVDEQGGSNWDDLVSGEDGEDAEDAEDEDASAGGTLDISGVNISDAFISYTDIGTGDSYTLSDVNLEVGRVSEDFEPVPASGRVHFDVQPAGISGHVELETVVAFDEDAGVVSLDGLSIEGLVEGLADVPTRLGFETDGIEVNVGEQVVTMQSVSMTALGINLSMEVEPFSYAESVQPTAKVEVDAFSPRSLMQTLDIEAPDTADPDALGYLVASATVYVHDEGIALADINAKMDDTTFTGSARVPAEATGNYTFEFRADTLDLNRYMAPAEEESTESTAESAPVEIPVDLIKALNANGRARIDAVRLGDLLLEEVKVGLLTGTSSMRIFPIEASLYGGKYMGDVRIDASKSSPVIAMNESLMDVDLGKLALAMFERENITGTINGRFRLRGSGTDISAIQRTLEGDITMELLDGIYEGTDIWYELRRARALIKKETPPEPELPARTRFSTITAMGIVEDGIIRNEDFVAELPFMRLAGRGEVNIPEGTVDYGLTARVYDRPEANEAATPEEIEDFTKTVVPLRITGPLASPKVVPDVEALLRQRVEEEIEDVLKDKLKGLFD